MPSSPTSRMTWRCSLHRQASARSNSYSWREAVGSVVATRDAEICSISIPASSRIARRTVLTFYILIVHDREQPGANIGAGLPQVSFIDGAREGLLDEIVRSIRVPSERPRIATKSGNFLLDKAMKFNQRRIPQAIMACDDQKTRLPM